MALQNYSSFLIKRNKQTYSTKPDNLKAHNAFHYNRLIHCRTLGWRWWPKGKVWWSSWSRNLASKSQWPPMCGPPSTRTPTLGSIWHMICNNQDGWDLGMAASAGPGYPMRPEAHDDDKEGSPRPLRTLQHRPPPKAIKVSANLEGRKGG